MTWAGSKGSPTLSPHPRPLSWIVASGGVLALFLVFASLVLVSYPIGSTVRGYFYGVDSSRNSDLSSTSPIDLVENSNKESSDLQPSMVENNDTVESNSQVPSSESAAPEVPVTKEVSDIEASDAAASSSQEPVTSFDRSPPQSHSQMNLTSIAPQPMAATSSSNVKSEEEALMNVSSTSMTTSNDTSLPPSNSTFTAVPTSSDKLNKESFVGSVNPGCDLFHGNWVYDPQAPLYTNESCPVLTQMENCQGNGRPDKDYENWRWKPSQCDLPRFDPKKFLELMRDKTLAFIGDSVARNQMESMMCMLWQVEEPKNIGNRNMQRFYFKSTSVTIIRIWSSWLVKHNSSEPFDYAPPGVEKLYLDTPDEKVMEFLSSFDVLVLSSGHWFAKQSVYIHNNEIVGGQLWWPDKTRPKKINNIEAFGISVETILSTLVTHPNYTGLTILRTYSPDHYEGGAWNTGGSCTGKVKPLEMGQLVENVVTNAMYEQQIRGYNRAIEKGTPNGSRLRLLDITEAYKYRHDGHPGPYRNRDPNKITKRGPDGRPPPQDCLHWCMPGPVDTWNELLLEIIRREYEGDRVI